MIGDLEKLEIEEELNRRNSTSKCSSAFKGCISENVIEIPKSNENKYEMVAFYFS